MPEPRPTTNPYLVQLLAALRAVGAQVHTFSWRFALLGRYDVFHVHWPENLARGRRRITTVIRQLALLVLLVRLRLRRIPIVATLHNPAQHERASYREALLLRLIRRQTAYGIALNPHTKPAPGQRVSTIPHGHYRDWYAGLATQAPVGGRIAYVGLIRAYKGVEDLIDAFRGLPGPDISLTVSGQPRTPGLAADLQRRAAGDDRIELELAYLADAEFVARVTQSELVVLPYRELQNSGVALAVLSLARPVLVPANPATADLAVEVGLGWVQTFEGALTAPILGEALERTRLTDRTTEPDMSRREWSGVGEAHLRAYAEALTGGRRPVRQAG